jgi:glycosyltransferase involved in cell wall biosynthesis
MKQTTGRPHTIGFIIEKALGHITHLQGIMRWAGRNETITPALIEISYDADDFLQKIPLIPFSIKISIRARVAVSALLQQQDVHCLYFHTQALALFSVGLMNKIPTVISLDATPINFDSIAHAYDTTTARGVIYRIKTSWFRRVFRKTALIVTFSEWVKKSLIQDYGVNAEKILVIPSGVDVNSWKPRVPEFTTSNRTKLLFVGGDFKRKGGEVLLDAFREGLSDVCDLDIVTRDDVRATEQSVRIHNGLTPNSPELKQLFIDADIFVMPTEGDASPFVILEAMASSLPVITIDVGAVDEIVADSVSGYLLSDCDRDTLIEKVLALANNPRLREDMGKAGRRIVENKFNAEKNYTKLLNVLDNVASGRKFDSSQ